MITLKKAAIHRYKCFMEDRTLKAEPDVTVLVGENDTGKTCLLEAMAKANYINRNDTQFSYHIQKDYPQLRKKELDASGAAPDAVTLLYEVSEDLQAVILQEMLLKPKYPGFARTTDYQGKYRVKRNGFVYEPSEFWKTYAQKCDPKVSAYVDALCKIRDLTGLNQLVNQCADFQGRVSLEKLKRFFENRMGWENPLSEYVYRTYLLPKIPRFVYYDEYYMLPGTISLKELEGKTELSPSEKTVKALLLLADVDINRMLTEEDEENTRAMLEQMSRDITNGFLKFWSTNRNLRLEFLLTEKKECGDDSGEKEGVNQGHGVFSIFHRKKRDIDSEGKGSSGHASRRDVCLEIRIYDTKNMVSLPLESRSRGFNWFLSFYIWFMAMEKNMDTNCIFLLDEPGQNLHAVAQEDLVKLLSCLAQKHQVIFTTHSVLAVSGDKWKEKTRCIRSTPTGADICKAIEIEEVGL